VPLPSRPADNVFVPAVTHWWSTKDKNTSGVGKSQGGTRDSNLRGDTMDGYRDVIISRLKELGVNEDDIFAGSSLAVSLQICRPTFARQKTGT
jgi:hypothetical protein